MEGLHGAGKCGICNNAAPECWHFKAYKDNAPDLLDKWPGKLDIIKSFVNFRVAHLPTRAGTISNRTVDRDKRFVQALMDHKQVHSQFLCQASVQAVIEPCN